MFKKLITLTISSSLCIFFSYIGFKSIGEYSASTTVLSFAFSLISFYFVLYSCGIKVKLVIFSGTICLALTAYVFLIDPEKLTLQSGFAWFLSIGIFLLDLLEHFQTKNDMKNQLQETNV